LTEPFDEGAATRSRRRGYRTSSSRRRTQTTAKVMAVRHRSLQIVGVQFHSPSRLHARGAPCSRATSWRVGCDQKPSRSCWRNSISSGRNRATRWRIMSGGRARRRSPGSSFALRAKGARPADEIDGCAEAMRRDVLTVSRQRGGLGDMVRNRRRRREHVQHLTEAALVRRRGRGDREARKHVLRPRRQPPPTPPRAGRRDRGAVPHRFETGAHRAGFDRPSRVRILFAQAHHPGHAPCRARRQRARHEHVFNPVLGPLKNPARGARAMIGVYAPGLTRTSPRRRAIGVKRAYVVHGAAGSTSSPVPARTSCARSRTAPSASTGLSTRSTSDISDAIRRSCAEAIRETFFAERTTSAPRRVTGVPKRADTRSEVYERRGGIAAAGHAEDCRGDREGARSDRRGRGRAARLTAPRRCSRRRWGYEVRRRAPEAGSGGDRPSSSGARRDGRHPSPLRASRRLVPPQTRRTGQAQSQVLVDERSVIRARRFAWRLVPSRRTVLAKGSSRQRIICAHSSRRRSGRGDYHPPRLDDEACAR